MAKPLSFAVVKGDRRQEILCHLLESDGHRARIIQEVGEMAQGPESHEIVVAAQLKEGEKFALRQNGLPWVEYISEGYLTANAVITAENALQVAMEHLDRTLNRSRILVMGFGRIGKVLASMLRGLGSCVTVSARKAGDLAMIRGLGMEALHTEGLATQLAGFDVIFNTVPHVVLDAGQLKQTKAEVLIIDLASAPGGVNFQEAVQLERKALHALALPGKLTPLSAAETIREAVYSALNSPLSEPALSVHPGEGDTHL